MTHEEFVNWLRDEVSNERMTQGEMDDLLAQKSLFDNNRSVIELEYNQLIVGYVAGQQRIADRIHELIDAAKMQFPGKMIYFEPIGFHIL